MSLLLTFHRALSIIKKRQDIEAFKQAFELPILTMKELDLKIAFYPPKPKKDRSQNKIIDQVMTKLDLESEPSKTLYSRRHAPDSTLHLAVSEDVRKTVFEEEAGQVLIEDGIIRLVTFDPIKEVIVRWIP